MVIKAMIKELADKLANDQLILFVGAGVSMSLDLPSYSKLIKEIGEQLDFDGDIFHDFGDYLTLAEYYHLRKPGLKDLQSYLRERWYRSDKEIKSSHLHKAIVDLGCSIIYTTNFDGLLEHAHRLHGKRYKTIRSVKDLVNHSPSSTQIIKFHGDINSPSTLVFTESSYFERLSFESPLDIRLRSDVLGKSVLFMGYSLADINMRYLLYKLQKQWESESDNELRPKSYVYIGRPNPVQEEVLRSRGLIPIVAESDNQSESLTNFLRNVKETSIL